jgi:hypothetical protein
MGFTGRTNTTMSLTGTDIRVILGERDTLDTLDVPDEVKWKAKLTTGYISKRK